jgi:hypothetical protein
MFHNKYLNNQRFFNTHICHENVGSSSFIYLILVFLISLLKIHLQANIQYLKSTKYRVVFSCGLCYDYQNVNYTALDSPVISE